MKELTFIILIFFISCISFATDITLETIQTLNGNEGANDYCLEVKAAFDGGTVTSGYSSDEMSANAVLIKYNSEGESEWLKTYRNNVNGIDYYSKIIIDQSNNIYVAGGTLNLPDNYDILIQKYSPSGDLIWTSSINSFSTNHDYPIDFQTDNMGNLLILFNDQVNPATPNVNLAKYSTNGNLIWHYRLNDTAFTGTSIEIDLKNNIYISGSRNSGASLIKISQNGFVKWIKGNNGSEQVLNYTKVITTDINSIYTLGDEQISSLKTIRLSKLDSNSNDQWSRTISINFTVSVHSITLESDNEGNVYYIAAAVPGNTDNRSGSTEGYIFGKYNSSGDSLWSRYIFNPYIFYKDEAYMKLSVSGEIFILCYTNELNQVGRLFKYSNTGDLISSGQFYNYNANGKIYSLNLNNSGNPVACGLVSHRYNHHDFLVISYNNDCSELWQNQYDSKGFSNDYGSQVLEDNNGNILVAGANGRESFLVKYNSSLQETWRFVKNDSDGFDPYNYFQPGIAIDNENNIYFSTTITREQTGIDIYVSKVSQSGMELFSIVISESGASKDVLKSMSTDEKGNLYLSGSNSFAWKEITFVSKYSQQGILQWSNSIDGFNFYQEIIAKDNALYFMRNNTVGKYDNNGTLVWERTFQPNNFINYFFDIQIDKNNSLVGCGTGVEAGQSENYIVVKYDSLGEQQWYFKYNGTRNSTDEAKSMAIDSVNNIIVSGYSSEVSLNYNVSITTLKLDHEGNFLWKRNISDPLSGNVPFGKVKLDKFDNVYVSSGPAYYTNINFSYMLTKYRSNGDSLWTSFYNNPRFRNYAFDFIISSSQNIFMTGKAYGINTSYDIATLKYSQIVGIQNYNSNIVTEYLLQQNYPNPFNPSTIINYSIPSHVKGQTSDVKLVVYNNLGKEIVTLVNVKQNAGSYTVDFNGEGLPSGVYFYKLEAGEFVETKRMILLK